MSDKKESPQLNPQKLRQEIELLNRQHSEGKAEVLRINQELDNQYSEDYYLLPKEEYEAYHQKRMQMMDMAVRAGDKELLAQHKQKQLNSLQLNEINSPNAKGSEYFNDAQRQAKENESKPQQLQQTNQNQNKPEGEGR